VEPLSEWMLEGTRQYAFLIEENKEIQDFCLGRHGYNFTHIGPVITKKPDIAKNLVSAALHNSIGRPVILDFLQIISTIFNIGH